MDHLVVLEGAISRAVETVGQLLRRGKDMTEKSQTLVVLTEPEGVDHSGHIDNLAGSHSPPHNGNHTQHHPHNGDKGSYFN
jgi:hypothetical protein